MLSPKQRQQKNIEALQALHTGDQKILEHYSGKGGISNSTDQYYTPQNVAEKIVQRLLQLQTPQSILEPSCGSGNFLSFFPQGDLTGIEIDPEGAAIAKARFPQAEIINLPFEHFFLKNRNQFGQRFSMIVGNPPFGTRRLPGLDLPSEREAARYFLRRCIDLCSEKGLIGMIVPNGIARHKNGNEYRKMLLESTEILGILALPTDTFMQAHASNATTDVFFLRRRSLSDQARLMVDPNTWQEISSRPLEAAFLRGEIHLYKPEWMCGEIEERRGYAGKMIYARSGTLEMALNFLTEAELHTPQPLPPLPDDEALKKRIERKRTKLRSDGIESGKTGITPSGQLQIFFHGWHNVTPEESLLLSKMHHLGKGIELHAQMQAFGGQEKSEELASKLLPALHEISQEAQKHQKIIKQISQKDPHILFTWNSIKEAKVNLPSNAPSNESIERIYHSLHERGPVTEARLTGELNCSDEQAVKQMLQAGFLRLPKGWVMRDEYFASSSQRRHHDLELLREMAKEQPCLSPIIKHHSELLKQATRLRSVEDIPLLPGNSVLTSEMLLDWVKHEYPELTGHIDIHSNSGEIEVTGEVSSKNTKTLNYLKRYLSRRGRYRTEAASYQTSDQSLAEYLREHWREEIEERYNRNTEHLTPIYDSSSVLDLIPDYAGPTPHANQNEALRRAINEQQLLDAQDVGLGKTITGLLHAALSYHQTGRTSLISVPRSVLIKWHRTAQQCFPDAHIIRIGEAEEENLSDAVSLSDHLLRSINENPMILLMTHETCTRIPLPTKLAVELIEEEYYSENKNLSRSKNMSQSMFNTYTNAKVNTWLEAGELTPEELEDIQKQTISLEEALDTTSGQDDENEQRPQVAQRRRFIARALQNSDTSHYTPLTVNWSMLNLGVIIIDEAHRFRRLMALQGRSNIKYLAAPNDASARAVDLYLKLRHASRNNTAIHLLTATPIQNSLSDLYSMIMLTRPNLFASYGIHNLEAFIERYVEVESREIADEMGNVQMQDYMIGIQNLDELQHIMRQVIHRRTAQDVGLKVPKVNRYFNITGVDEMQENIISEIAQNPVEAVVKYLRPDLKLPNENTEEWNKLLDQYRLTISSLLRKAEMDLELLDPIKHQGHVAPKIANLIQDASEAIKQGQKFVLFCDILHFPPAIPSGKNNPNGYHFHEKLRQLIAAAANISTEKIGLINGHDTPDPDQKMMISDAFNNGTLQGVIGTRGSMGEGVDLQQGDIILLSPDVPWNPGGLQQSEGRVARYPNPADYINATYHLSNRALDPHMLDILTGKMPWYDAIWTSNAGNMHIDFGPRIPTREEILTLRLRDQGERDAALSEIRKEQEKQKARGEERQAFTALETAQRIYDALEKHKQKYGDLKPEEPQYNERERLEASLRRQEKRLLAWKSILEPHLNLEQGLACDGIAIQQGQVLSLQIKGDIYKNHQVVVKTVWRNDTEGRGFSYTLLPPLHGQNSVQTIFTVQAKNITHVSNINLQEMLQPATDNDQPSLNPIYASALEKALKTWHHIKGTCHFIFKENAVHWSLPQENDILITALNAQTYQEAITTYLNSPQALKDALENTPEATPGLLWTTENTPQALAFRYLGIANQ